MSWHTERDARNVFAFSQAAGSAAMQTVLLDVRNNMVHPQI